MVELVALNKFVDINTMFIYEYDSAKYSPPVKNNIKDLVEKLKKKPKKWNVPNTYKRKGHQPIKFSILDV
jgi:hypothetical protein